MSYLINFWLLQLALKNTINAHVSQPKPVIKGDTKFCSNINAKNCSFNKLCSQSRRAIYEENCFKPPGSGKGAAFLQDTLENMCLEKRAFYRAVSGLHSRYFNHDQRLMNYKTCSSNFFLVQLVQFILVLFLLFQLFRTFKNYFRSKINLL